LSTVSPSCRIDWRPSRQLCGALFVLGLLAAVSVGLSDLPWLARLPLAGAALAQGGWLAWREWRRVPCALEFDGEVLLMHAGATRTALSEPRLRLRGSLACVQARDPAGLRHVLLWCADTLPIASRRQLRLRLGGQSAA
jgi:toxin CptA